MVDIRQSSAYAKYLKTQGWIVKTLDNTNYFIKRIAFIGAVMKLQRPKRIDFKTIEKLQTKHKVFQTIIEPDLPSIVNSVFDHNLLISNGYKLSKSPYLPTKTVHINLKRSMKKITADMDKKTRYSIRRGDSVKIKTISSPKDLEKFHHAWKKSVKLSRYVPSLQSLINLKACFPKPNSLFLTSHNISGKIIGGAVFTKSGHDFSYYWYGFTGKQGRTSLSQYALLYQGILWGKRMGCSIFDFEGVYDDRFPNKSWFGFSTFKKNFGGREVLYPGCYTKSDFLARFFST